MFFHSFSITRPYIASKEQINVWKQLFGSSKRSIWFYLSLHFQINTCYRSNPSAGLICGSSNSNIRSGRNPELYF